MGQWWDDQADLIYLDPPFNSNRDYNILYGTDSDTGRTAQRAAFTDTWSWDAAAEERSSRLEQVGIAQSDIGNLACGLKLMLGHSPMLAYLTYMAERLIEMRRVLKPDGSIYLHCDPTASHYLKAVMDAVFGKTAYRNEIIWGYEKPRSAKRVWRRNHDTLLFYAGAGHTFNPQRVPTLDGKFEMRKPVKRPDGSVWHPKEPGKQAGSWWYDIPSFATRMTAKERLGYPTQKPLALLERIVKASSNPGDLVLDPFAGCGTAVDAAHRLGRRWAGIDVGVEALRLTLKMRLEPQGVAKVTIHGIPKDLESARLLAETDPFKFEQWIVQHVPGLAHNERPGPDGGVDGRGWTAGSGPREERLVLAQVFAGARPPITKIREFGQVLDAHNAAMGVFLTLDYHPTKTAREVARQMGRYQPHGTVGDYPRMAFWSAKDWSAGRTPPLPPMLHPVTGKPYEETLFSQTT